MNLEVLGHRVLVKPDPLEKVSSGGIIVVNEASDNFKREEGAIVTGTVVSIGPTAWLDPGLGGTPWVAIGDHVVYGKYAGKKVKDPVTEEEYQILNDEDIQIKIHNSKDV